MDPESDPLAEKKASADGKPFAGSNSDGATTADRGLDLAAVEPLRIGNPDLWQKLIGIYLETTPPSLAALEQALSNNDCPSAHMTAHTVKSSSANMGAIRLAELCRQLERAAGEGNLETGPALFAEIHDEFNIVSTQLARDGKDAAVAGNFTA